MRALRTMIRGTATAAACTTTLLACGGGSSGPGALHLVVEPEVSITDGLLAGSNEEDVQDGWAVSFSKYVVSIGNVVIARSSGGGSHAYPSVHVIDLAALPTTGFELVDEPSIASGRWDRVSYDLPAPTATSVRDPHVSQTDFDAMIAGGCTYLIAGTLTKTGGQSCPPGGSCRATSSIAFQFCAPATQSFVDCGPESGLPGLVVNASSSVSVALTIHGDHLFFDRFPAGAEIVTRRAQWLADADVNGDDVVDVTDLAAIDTPTELSQLFPSALHNLANAPNAIDDAFDYVVAQLRTQGHFQGEGECAFPTAP